jgi:glycosyltransferase involved in cell wall biosynthesis
MRSSNLSIVVCTRNRPVHLNRLLFSIEKSFLHPREVIVISSGDDITHIIHEHSDSLKIKHFHTKLVGQSNQKKISFKYLDKESSWVFFLDDDLEITPLTISEAIKCINGEEGTEIAGIGAKLLSSFDKSGKSTNKFSIDCINLNKGKIKKSGKAVKYMFDKRIETEWLNGASIWQKSSLENYDLPILNSRYAAYEDVIFSSRVARSSKLLYEPRIEVVEQISHSQISVNIIQFKYITLWTGYLVCNRDGSTLTGFKILTLLRAFHFKYKSMKFKSDLNLFQLMDFLNEVMLIPRNNVEAQKRILNMIEKLTI